MSQQPYGHAPTGPPPSPAQAPATRQAGPRRLGIVAVALAAIALGFAVAAWLRAATAPDASPAYTQQQVADAKKAVCEAFEKTDRAIQTAGHRVGGDDPTEKLAVAANVRLALIAGSAHLSEAVEKNVATPAALAASAQRLALTYRQVALDQLGEAPQRELDPVLRVGDSTTQSMRQACA